MEKILIIFFFTLVCYINSLTGAFVFDDRTTIIDNPHIKNIYDIRHIYTSAPSRFIPNLTFAFNYFWGGSNTLGFHAVNLAIHIAAALAVYWFCRLIITSYNQSAKKNVNTALFPLFTALLFAVHPVQTQAVSYISQRYTLVAALFYLLSLYLYLAANFSGKKRAVIFYAGSILFQLFAHFSKEFTFTLPFAAVLLDYMFISRSITKLARKFFVFLPYFFVSILAYILLFYPLFGNPTVIDKNLSVNLPTPVQSIKITGIQYLTTEFSVITTYFRLLLFPARQNADYDYPVYKNFLNTQVLLPFTVIVASLIFAVLILKKHRPLSFGIFFFFLTVLPESSVIPIDDVINEHRLYLSSLGFFIFLSYLLILLYEICRRKKTQAAFWVFFILLIFSYLLATIRRNEVWQNELSFWSDVVKKSPHKTRGHYNLAVALINQNRFDSALEELSTVIKIDDKYVEAYNNIAGIYKQKQIPSEAEKYYRQALKVDPSNIFIINNLTSLYLAEKRYGEGIAEYEKLLDKGVDIKEAYNGLGVVYFTRGDRKQAVVWWQKATAADPRFVDPHLNLASAYKNESKLDEATEEYKKAIDLDYGNFIGYYNLGLIYLQQGKLDLARQNTDKAIIFNRDFAQAYNSLGVIYARQGKTNLAIYNFKKAFMLAPNFVEAKKNWENLSKNAIQL